MIRNSYSKLLTLVFLAVAATGNQIMMRCYSQKGRGISVLLLLVCIIAGLAPVSFAADKRTDKLYELYNSTSTPKIYKQILKQYIDRRERIKKLRANAGLPITADSAFKLGRVYAVPNPAVGVKHPIIHIEAGLADKVEIKIYDSAGKLVEEATLTEPPALIKGVYAYEYKFVSNNTPYGTCSYTVLAFKSGFGPIEASGKMIFVNTGH